jgi:hypothetical protein
MLRTSLTAFALVWALPAAAQTVKIATGEQIEVTVSDGAAAVTSRGKAPPSPWEMWMGGEFDAGKHAEASGTNPKAGTNDGVGPNAPTPAPDRLRIRLTATAKGNALLVIENGYAEGMIYRARMTSGGRSAPTDVCIVLPGLVGIEHWPFPLDAIELSEIRLVPWKTGDAIPCA